MPVQRVDKATARALRATGSFASPTRSSAAKTKNSKGAQGAAGHMEGARQCGPHAPAQPLLSTFRQDFSLRAWH